MLKISRMSDYAIVLLTTLARGETPQSNARALAERTGLSQPTVGKLLKTLTASGLLTSQQGRHGGYRLARAADEISIADIVEAIDGPIAMTECYTADHDCEREANCSVRPHWNTINRGVRELLTGTTLATLSEPVHQVPIWFKRDSTGVAKSAPVARTTSGKP
ncbi:SUF system Fe-S cluster assembly regulator [Halothiobacillus diazotrophicus]|uniref:SUF system Fe-S cluster assembly regulator n=1 Tax=Halothiobacillus diazotrophicus TaxID=1860122 RepID=A0A191ZEN3_9GAMM|nr:SUF system Fe-S cluster assembly regulator [Halothiobacillus diazotrophicus]ANJ66329.1 SUF system Fe-S cluster assembly regulator [Halothiobacillus diazotrophicus]